MHTNESPAGLGKWTRCAWLAPMVLVLVGCGGGGSSGEPAPGAVPAAAAAVSPDMLGQWETIMTSVPPFYDGAYGGAPPGDGSLGVMFYFAPDGHYKHSRNLVLAYFGGNCFRTEGWDEEGTTSGTGPEYTFTASKASYVVTDTCGKNQIVPNAPTTPGTHTLRLEKDATGWPHMRMSFPEGDLVMEKCRHC